MSDIERAKAAVLDASFLDKGRLNIGGVKRLAAGLAARSAELWIPEVVLLEFAVHWILRSVRAGVPVLGEPVFR